MKPRIVHFAEYLFVRSVVAILRAIPYRAALSVGWFIAFLSHYILRFRVKRAVERLRLVFGAGLSDRQVRSIAWLSWRNFIFCVVDMTRLPSVTLEWVKLHITGWEESEENLRKHLATGVGAVVACPHMGSWEAAGVALQMLGFPIFFLTGKQSNPYVDAYINRLRGSTGIDTVQRGSSMLKGTLGRLKHGHVLAFLPDVRMATEGIPVKFLGGVANVPAGMGLFARQAGVPIITGIVTRVGWTRLTLRLHKPVWPDQSVEKREDWRRMTQEVFDEIDRAIRDKPEQWFWFNKRWILDPL